MNKIGVYICECGPNISEKIDIDRAIKELSQIKEVHTVARYKLLCSGDGKEYLIKSIKENKFTHIVLGACSHKQHEATFMKVCEEAGMNPFLLNLINIREQCAWMTSDKNEATSKAIRCLKAGISRVRYQEALEKKFIKCNADVLVIGGGITGVQASLLLAAKSRKVYLVEKASELGGLSVKFQRLYQDGNSASMVKQNIEKVFKNKNVQILTNSEVKEVLGFFGNFMATIDKQNQEVKVNIGAVVVATGCKLFDPKEMPKYGYGKYDDIYTSLEIEFMNLRGDIRLKNGKLPQSVAIIHCVGREEKGYCSKICCNYSTKFHDYLKEKIKGVKVYELYHDLCTSRFEMQRKDVTIIHVLDVNIIEKQGTKTVEYQSEDGEKQNITADMVILLPVIMPGPDVAKLAEILNIPLDNRGFFAEEHVKLNPVATSLEGIFIAGCAQGPKDIRASVTQSEAVAGKILSSLIPGKKLEPEVMVSHICEALCKGCKTCLTVCAYGAIEYNDFKGVCITNEVLCRGCGNCASACPSDAIIHKHFTSRQIYQELIETI